MVVTDRTRDRAATVARRQYGAPRIPGESVRRVQNERRRRIAELVTAYHQGQEWGRATTRGLARSMRVARATIEADLEVMESLGILHRVGDGRHRLVEMLVLYPTEGVEWSHDPRVKLDPIYAGLCWRHGTGGAGSSRTTAPGVPTPKAAGAGR